MRQIRRLTTIGCLVILGSCKTTKPFVSAFEQTVMPGNVRADRVNNKELGGPANHLQIFVQSGDGTAPCYNRVVYRNSLYKVAFFSVEVVPPYLKEIAGYQPRKATWMAADPEDRIARDSSLSEGWIRLLSDSNKSCKAVEVEIKKAAPLEAE